MRAPAAFLALVLAAASTAGAHAETPPLAKGDPAPAPPSLAPDGSRQLRFTSGVALTSAGGLMLVLGSVLGLRAIVSKNQIGSHCDATGRCDLNGYSLGSEATDFALISTVSFVVAAVGLGAGIPLLVTGLPKAPSPKPATSARLTLTASGLSVDLRF
jgi:hypothetical protein